MQEITLYQLERDRRRLQIELLNAQEKLDALLFKESDYADVHSEVLKIKELMDKLETVYKAAEEKELSGGATMRLRDVPKYTNIHDLMKLTKEQRQTLYQQCLGGRSCYLVDEECFYEKFFNEDGEY